MFRMFRIPMAVAAFAGFASSAFPVRVLGQLVEAFRDDFATNPNANGRWTIHRAHPGEPATEARWNAAQENLSLTTATQGRGVALFARHNLVASRWEAEFACRIGGDANPGADGLVFCFYKDRRPFGTPALGGTLGFITPQATQVAGYGLELDTYRNTPEIHFIDDPSGSHLALIYNNSGNHLGWVNRVRLDDDQWHHLRIAYDFGRVEVAYDGTPALSVVIADPDQRSTGVGFCSATGAWADEHRIDNFVLRVDPLSVVPPAPPTDLDVSASAIGGTALLVWRPSPSPVTRYIVERKIGCQETWETIEESVPAAANSYRDSFPPDGQYVCYRVRAANDAGPSEPGNVACVVTLAQQRIQLKIYDPTALNPNSEEPGAWVPMVPCHPKFDEDHGTAVIVHGWNPRNLTNLNQYAFTLDVARAISETRRFEEAERPNVLAWDWLQEAEGSRAEAFSHVADQAQKFNDTARYALPSGYPHSVQLRGYSYGGQLVAQAGVLLTTADEVRGNAAIPVRQVTFWDPPTRLLFGAGHPIEDDVEILRSREVYVDLYSGLLATEHTSANIWIDVPGTRLLPEGHDVFRWYITTIPTGTNPQLVNPRDFPVLGENSTIGFGTSVLLGDDAHRPDDGCPAPNLGTLMFNHRWRTPDRVFYLRGYQCAFRGSSTPQGTAATDGGVFNGDCDPSVCVSHGSTRIAIGTASSGEGGGGGGQTGTSALTATFGLDLTIDPAWDELSFQYDFTAAPAEATLIFSITVAGETTPLWVMSSSATLDDGLLDSGLFTVTALQGQVVTLRFDLTSVESGAQVIIQEITFWQSPTHGNRPPMANAGPDQTVAADANGFAIVHLDGSGTTDADGDDLLYWWELDGELFADGVRPSEELYLGQHRIRLVVRDPVDNISTDEVSITVTGDPAFIRGDSNNDGTVDISDAINTLGFLFTGGGRVTCEDAADANDSGDVDISDAIFTLGFLFLGTPHTLPPPHPNLGPDETVDPLGCERC